MRVKKIASILIFVYRKDIVIEKVNIILLLLFLLAHGDEISAVEIVNRFFCFGFLFVE